jgi:hypothetical protein
LIRGADFCRSSTATALHSSSFTPHVRAWLLVLFPCAHDRAMQPSHLRLCRVRPLQESGPRLGAAWRRLLACQPGHHRKGKAHAFQYSFEPDFVPPQQANVVLICKQCSFDLFSRWTPTRSATSVRVLASRASRRSSFSPRATPSPRSEYIHSRLSFCGDIVGSCDLPVIGEESGACVCVCVCVCECVCVCVCVCLLPHSKISQHHVVSFPTQVLWRPLRRGPGQVCQREDRWAPRFILTDVLVLTAQMPLAQRTHTGLTPNVQAPTAA